VELQEAAAWTDRRIRSWKRLSWSCRRLLLQDGWLSWERSSMNAMRRTVLRRPASMRLAALQLRPGFPQQQWQVLLQHQRVQALRPSASASRAFCSDPGSAAERIQTKLAAHFAVRWRHARLICLRCTRA
jgi:hypothetical protein